MTYLKKFLLGLLLLVGPLDLRAETASLDTDALAPLAVQDHGRKKPFTTFAHETLLTLSGKSPLPIVNPDGTTSKIRAETVILNLWFRPVDWDQKPLIMVSYLDLKKKMGLPEEQKLFTYNELIASKPLMDLLDEAHKQRQAGKGDTLPALEKEAEHLGERLKLFQDLVDGNKKPIVPNPASAEGHWSNPVMWGEGVDKGRSIALSPQANDLFRAWWQAYDDGDLAKFNTLTPDVIASLRAIAPQYYPSAAALQFEHHYMQLDPFLWAWIIYLVALIVLVMTALWMTRPGYLITWALVLLGLGFEVYGFACRIIISGRPPVTDLYETVIWVSFVAMAIAVLLEAIYRKRYFLYAGLPASILMLIVADSQPTILDASINPLTAVLRDNMWLTIHVLSIVSSYAAFALTAALGHIALVMSLWGKKYKAAQGEVHYFIYRAMQIGILLLAIGTILGGVWANYSWGRFWGWDPKETWALITLLCYLALVHGRLAGWWRGYGLAIGSVLCFLSVMMSWYGVNFILGQNGKSLHSYGLSTGGLTTALGFAIFELIFVAVIVLLNRRQNT